MNCQRDQFLRELIGPVIIAAAGNINRYTKSIVIGSDNQVSAGLGGRVGAIGQQRQGLNKQSGFTQSSVHFVGRNLKEFNSSLVFLAVLV